MSETSLKKAIQSLGRGGACVRVGRVSRQHPLRVTLENDEAVTLGEASLCLPAHLREYSVRLSVPALGLEQEEARVDASLRAGERVYLLSADGEKRYVVIGRVSG